MNLTLTTPAAIAVVIVVGLMLSSLFIVLICVAAQRLPGGRFDEHQAEALAGTSDGRSAPAVFRQNSSDWTAATREPATYVEHVDQALVNGDGRPPFSCPGYGEITGSCCFTADSPKPADCQLRDRALPDAPTQLLAPVIQLVQQDAGRP